MLKLLRDGAGALGLTLDDAQLAAFGRCCDLLLEKNAVMNLTAITEPAEVARLHFLDSLALLKLADFRGKRVVDVGCGAGFPGVPLLIGEPSIRLSLLDSTAKRMQWLSDELLPALGLEAECLTGRAEELIEGRRETYDLCVSRAVARLNVLCELCLPYVKPGGAFLAMKGPELDTELKEAYAGIEDGMSLRVTEEDSVPQVLSEEDRESLVRFMTELIDGVNTWSADMDGLVESSSNLGIFTLDENGISGSSYIRSSVGEKEQEILDAQAALASSCGYETETVKMADPWPYDPDSRLLAMTKEIYLAQNGEEINVSAVHAGLECGTFKLLNPDLDMISIGPDISDAHTIRETLYLDSVPKVWNLLAELLIQIGKE